MCLINYYIYCTQIVYKKIHKKFLSLITRHFCNKVIADPNDRSLPLPQFPSDYRDARVYVYNIYILV